MEVLLHFLFGVFGNAGGLFLFLSPIPTFRRILKQRSTEDFSGIPYNLILLDCLLTAWQEYGLPFVTSNNLLVVTINVVGTLIQSIYVVMFLVFAPKELRVKMLGLLAFVLTVFTTVALVSLFVLHGENRKLFCGCVATVISICMYASPLSVMGLVVRTKSVEFMPFLLSMFVFLSATSWCIYGILGHEFLLTLRNGFGSVIGAVQLILYAIYSRPNEGTKKSPRDEMERSYAEPLLYEVHVQPHQANGQNVPLVADRDESETANGRP